MRSPFAPIYEFRERLIGIYAKHTRFIRVLLRFMAAFFMVMAIDSKTGYAQELGSLPAALGISLLCCVIPWGMVTAVMSLVLLVQFFKVSFIVALVGLVIVLMMVLIDLLFAPGYQGVVFFVPLFFFFKLPFLLPLILGLIAPVTSVIPMLFGLVLYFMMDYVSTTAGVLADATEAAGMSDRFMQLIDGLTGNWTLMVIVAAFSITVVIVYIIHRLSIDYAWAIAVAAGMVTDLVLVLFGGASSETAAGMDVVYVVVSSLASGAIAYLLQFMIFAVDYKRTEITQFEDDEYYYYVKAVPKVRVAGKEYDKIDILKEEDAEKPEEPEHPEESAGSEG